MPAMIFGQSLFDAVLDRLAEEQREKQDIATPIAGIRGLNAGFVTASIGMPLPDGESRLHDAYFDFDEPPPRQQEQSAEPAAAGKRVQVFTRLTPQEIAEDLRLSEASSAETLQRLRRQFARQNHPDMVDEEWREQATLRMKIANLLIDEALKRLPANAR
jgi:hypothetical protein